jgi:nucleoside diphosphate kinase
LFVEKKAEKMRSFGKKELTLGIIKPDVFQARAKDKVIDIIKKNGFVILDTHVKLMEKEEAEAFYG